MCSHTLQVIDTKLRGSTSMVIAAATDTSACMQPGIARDFTSACKVVDLIHYDLQLAVSATHWYTLS